VRRSRHPAPCRGGCARQSGPSAGRTGTAKRHGAGSQSHCRPSRQDRKIASIGAASKDLTAALNVARQPAPTDQDVIAAIRDTAAALSKVAGSAAGPGAESARRVSDLLVKLAQSDTAVRSKAEAAVIPPLIYDLDGLRKSLDPQEITLKTLPASLVGTWLLPDGRARVEVLPNGDPTEATKPAFCENLRLRCWPPNRRRQVRRSATSSRARRRRRLRRSGNSGARVDSSAAFHRLASRHRRAADPDSAAPGGRGNVGGVRYRRIGAELRQHHRAAAGRGRCVQDLLHQWTLAGCLSSVIDARSGSVKGLHDNAGNHS
jgi:hypothetical protein